LDITISPVRIGCALLAIGLVALLYRRIEVLGQLTLVFCIGVLLAAAWMIVEGLRNFDSTRAFDLPAAPGNLMSGMGQAMVLAIYCYLGYYNICYIGDEVKDPARTVPRAVLLSAVIVGLLFVALHVSMLGTISWESARDARIQDENYNLPAEF